MTRTGIPHLFRYRLSNHRYEGLVLPLADQLGNDAMFALSLLSFSLAVVRRAELITNPDLSRCRRQISSERR